MKRTENKSKTRVVEELIVKSTLAVFVPLLSDDDKNQNDCEKGTVLLSVSTFSNVP